MRATVVTIGCRLNQSEGDSLKRLLVNDGYKLVPADSPEIDLVIINTCTVTQAADRSSLSRIYRAIREPSRPKIFVTGCLAQRNKEELLEIPGVSRVITQLEKEESIKDFLIMPQRSRGFLKIQDGCEQGCSFCIASKIRGSNLRSKPKGVVKKEVNELKKRGFYEIVLVGLNLGSYGKERNDSLSKLLKELNAEGVRIRLSSLQPETFSKELLPVISQPPIAPHFHIPLQSGDNQILKRIGRNYQAEDFSELVKKIKNEIPTVNIGTDVIVGFPFEDDNSFMKTKEFLEGLDLGYLHIFSFSPRPLTESFYWQDKIEPAIKKARVKILRELSIQKSYNFRTKFQGRVLDAIVESNGWALTENYIRVRLKNNHLPSGIPVKVKIEAISLETTFGSIIKN